MLFISLDLHRISLNWVSRDFPDESGLLDHREQVIERRLDFDGDLGMDRWRWTGPMTYQGKLSITTLSYFQLTV